MPVFRQRREHPVGIGKQIHLCLPVHANREFAEGAAQTQLRARRRVEQRL